MTSRAASEARQILDRYGLRSAVDVGTYLNTHRITYDPFQSGPEPPYLVLLRGPDGRVLGEGRADSIDDAYTIALADLLTKSGEPPASRPPADAAEPAEPVVLPLDAPAVSQLARYLTVVINHLRHGAPMPPYEAFDFGDTRVASVMWEIRDQLEIVQPYYMGPPNPYRGAMSEPVALTLRLAPATALAVEQALYVFGEHYAAGAPVEAADEEVVTRVESVLAELVDSGLTAG